MSSATGCRRSFVSCLTAIESLLAQDDVIGAAALVDELNAAIASGPEPMTEAELTEAHRALVRCGELESLLRQSTLEALQRLGATRRSQAYRHP